jgi:serine protease Do
VLDQLQSAIATVTETVAPSIVRVRAGGARSVGVVVATDRVLTNAHGVPPEGEVHVRFADGTDAVATVTARDTDGDLAVLTVPTGDRTPVAWADTAPGVGTPVVVVVPSRGTTRTTFGTVSSIGRRFRGPGGRPIVDGVEHTAPLARGSSGSPLLDLEGRLVGVNTHRTEPFYLAVPVSERLRERADALGRGEVPVRRQLGVQVAPPHVAARLRSAVGLSPRAGVLVREVGDDGAAAAAGIERGDLITTAGGSELRSPDDLFGVLADSPAEVELTVVRGEDERTVTVSFEA